MSREAWEEVWEEVTSSHCCHHPASYGDNDDDARGEEQKMPYTNVDALSLNQRKAERERVTTRMATTMNTSTTCPGSALSGYQGRAMVEFMAHWQQ